MTADIKKISRELISHNILPSGSGYYYLRDALIILLQSGEYETAVFKKLYNQLGEKYGKSAGSIEKAITSSIEKSFGNINMQTRYGTIVGDNFKLTNKCFIMQLYFKIRSDGAHS